MFLLNKFITNIKKNNIKIINKYNKIIIKAYLYNIKYNY